jgi:hypothetical protein
MWAHQMISLVRRWLPDREISLMGDTAYTILGLGLHAKTQQVTLITTLTIVHILVFLKESTVSMGGNPAVSLPRFRRVFTIWS